MPVVGIRFGIEHNRAAEHRQYPLAARAHILLPKLEVAAIFLFPALIEEQDQIHSPPHPQCRVDIEVRMDAEVSSARRLVQSTAGKMRVGQQAAYSGQLLQ